jgi:acetoin utilization protein AcuB
MERASHNNTNTTQSIRKPSFTCKSWMTRRVRTVKPSDSVADAEAVLKKHHIGQAPVVDEGKVIGIITDRDLQNAVTASATLGAMMGSEKPAQFLVEAVMTRKVPTLNCQSSLLRAAQLLRRGRIGALPITNGESLVGIVTRSDILDAFIAREGGKPRSNRRSRRTRNNTRSPRQQHRL